MAVSVHERDHAAPANERLHSAMIQGAALIVIVALAAALRFGELGARAFQADEAIASLVAAQFARGGGYEHLPVRFTPTAPVG